MVTGQVTVQAAFLSRVSPVPVVANCSAVFGCVLGTAVPRAVTPLNPQEPAWLAAVIVQELGTEFSVICAPPAAGMASAAENTICCAAARVDRFVMVKIMFKPALAGPACTWDWLKVLVRARPVATTFSVSVAVLSAVGVSVEVRGPVVFG